MMKVSFPEIDEAYLRGKVENGYYSSVSEAIRDAVRKQRENEQSRLLTALEDAERDIKAGRVEPFTRELFDTITHNGIAKARNGEKIARPGVLPQ